MKTRTLLKLLCAFGFAATAAPSLHAAPFGSAFTYQGRLNFSGTPVADGLYDFSFTLHDAATLGSPVGGAVAINAVPVTNGLFTAPLDFGSAAFTSGEARWLQLQVNTNGVTPLAALNPRQRLAPTPQAIYAGNAATASAVAPGAVTSAGLAPASVDSAAIADGSIGAADLAPSLFNGTFWKLSGNAGPGNFLGSLDNQPVEFRVNNQTALRLLPNLTSPNIVGGHAANLVNATGSGAFIGGGGSAGNYNIANGNYAVVVGGDQNRAFGTGTFIGGGSSNRVEQTASFVGGGSRNTAGWPYSTVAGGFFNNAFETNGTIGGGSGNVVAGVLGGSTIAGGLNNRVNLSQAGTIAGGIQNRISDNSHVAAIGGGFQNFIETNGSAGTIGGGQYNLLTESRATIGGGYFNSAHGEGSTIGGGQTNLASGQAAVVAGGSGNVAAARQSAVGGGFGNRAHNSSATIGGGTLNTNDALASVIGGGQQNFLGTNVYDSVEFGLFTNSAAYSVISGGSANRNIGRFSVIGGGSLNRIGTSQFPVNYATIAGGSANFASGDSASVGGGSNNAANGYFSTIPGGRDNRAGPQSFAAGTRAKADQAGSFVWADDTEADFASTTNKQFAVRANNGVMIQAANTALDLRGGGGVRVEGAGVNSSTPVFIHRVTATSVSGNITIIDHPHCNGNPGAILIITHNYSADIAANKYATEPVGVWYNGTRWTIFHENNLVPMPVGRAFNVMVIKP